MRSARVLFVLGQAGKQEREQLLAAIFDLDRDQVAQRVQQLPGQLRAARALIRAVQERPRLHVRGEDEIFGGPQAISHRSSAIGYQRSDQH